MYSVISVKMDSSPAILKIGIDPFVADQSTISPSLCGNITVTLVPQLNHKLFCYSLVTFFTEKRRSSFQNSKLLPKMRHVLRVKKIIPNTIPAVCVPSRSCGKGTGIVISIIQTQLWEREGNRELKKFENR